MEEDLSGLNLVELIDRLEMVLTPEPVSLWPQTWGWVWLGLAVAALLAYGLHRFIHWRRANAYRRAALEELARVHDDPAAIAAILRRAALAAYPRTNVASLYGDDWLAFLDRTLGGSSFSNGPGRVLATAPYTPAPPSDGLASLAADWVQRHKGNAYP
ncbi:MAG: DUF4381 domain-containing protein [Pseudomonadota bacterium]